MFKPEVENGVNIRVMMLRKGITQTGVAKELGLTPSSVNKWISKRSKSTRITKTFIAKGFPEEWFNDGMVV
ncbi:MAG: helix-turn-helix transcriptional regulator [Deltaproteobacteria bacterium]|nr:helix-turn-helix transcriptional regulator [Deltaproteobacteria bacterium]